jgi:hypothetical protein
MVIRKMQRIGFGKLVGLRVEDGEPVENQVDFARHIRMHDSEIPPPPTDDFMLKKEHLNFFDTLETIDTGVIDVVEIRNGLPCEIIISGKA